MPVVLLAAVLAFGLTGVGATVIDLTGSDTAPGSGQNAPACASALVVSNPVANGGPNNNKITHVSITGDMSACAGQTLLAAVSLSGTPEMAYGVYQFPEGGATTVDLTFDASTGAFHDTLPTASGGTLVPAGALVEPPKAKDFGQVQITIGSTWE